MRKGDFPVRRTGIQTRGRREQDLEDGKHWMLYRVGVGSWDLLRKMLTAECGSDLVSKGESLTF